MINEKQISMGDKLKEIGLKLTKGRKAIIEILEKSNQPVSVEQLYLELIRKNQKIDISTIYRTMEVLHENDILRKHNILGEEGTVYEYMNGHNHNHYLVCLDCKKIVVIEKCPLGSYEKKLEEETEFEIESHRLYLYGHCSSCRKLKEGKINKHIS